MKKFCKRGHLRGGDNLSSSKACKTCCRIITNQWKLDNPQREHESDRLHAWKTLGIRLTIPEWNELKRQQNDCCAICARPASYFSKELAVDHDHTTGKVRGLLCSACNYLVGQFEKRAHLVYEYLHG